MAWHRIEVEYKVRDWAIVDADTKAKAKKLGKDTRNWIDNGDPYMVQDTVVVKSVTKSP